MFKTNGNPIGCLPYPYNLNIIITVHRTCKLRSTNASMEESWRTSTARAISASVRLENTSSPLSKSSRRLPTVVKLQEARGRNILGHLPRETALESRRQYIIRARVPQPRLPDPRIGHVVRGVRGVVSGATEPNLAPDADPLAPEDSKSNSKQLKLKLSVWLVTNDILYHAFCQIVTGYGTQSLGLELCLLAA